MTSADDGAAASSRQVQHRTHDRSPHRVERAATVRRYYRLVDADDVSALLALFDDDAVYCRPGFAPLVGVQELEHFYRRVRSIRAGVHTLNSVIADGRQIVAVGEFVGVLKDDRPAELRFADHFVFNDSGLVVRRETFFAAPLV